MTNFLRGPNVFLATPKIDEFGAVRLIPELELPERPSILMLLFFPTTVLGN